MRAKATLDSTVAVPGYVLFQELGGEAALLNLKTNHYFGLDEVGTRIWTLMAERGQMEMVFQALLDEYEVSNEILKVELLNFVDELISERLIIIQGPSAE